MVAEKTVKDFRGLCFCRTLYTVFHKKDPFLFFSYFTQMMINLDKIFTSCSWRNIQNIATKYGS